MTGRMPPERFAELWKSTGLSLRELAGLLGMNGRHAATHLREMADGVRPVPGPTGVAMQALADGWRPGVWPEADDIDYLIEDCTRLAETPTCKPLAGCHNGYGRTFRDCAAMLRRLTGRGE